MVIGRGALLDSCGAALSRALDGHGGLLVFAGEAGIGKTTMARAVADAGAAAGAEVRWGACWEGDASPPFGAWLDVLRRPGGDVCAAVADQMTGGEAPADAPAATRARARFFVQVVDALREVASVRPQVIVLEDLHWSDMGTRELLRAVAPHLPTMAALVVGTHRTEEHPATGAWLAGLGGAAEHLGLEGLDRTGVGEVLAEVLGRQPSPDETASVHLRTGGNPLFITQVGRLLATGSAATVPTGVRPVLERRLARVSSGCHRVLGAASVLGTEFSADVVADLLGDAHIEVLELIDEACDAGLVSPADRTDRWTWAHDLLRTTRYETLGVVARAALHRRAVDVLGDRGEAAGIRAHHAGRARFEPGEVTPARLAAAAAREALDRFAWEDAARSCQRALDALPDTEAADDVRAEALLALGDARLRQGSDEAADAYEDAAAIGRRRGRPELVARAALGFGAGLGGFEVRLLDQRQIDLLEEAATTLPGDAPLRPLVLARLSVALSFLGSSDRRLELATEAIDLARQRGDDRALAAALAARCDVLAGPAHVDERRRAADEIVVAARRVPDLPLELLGRRLRVVALLEQRHLGAFDAEVATFAGVAQRLGDPLYAWWVPRWRAMRAHADGDLGEAERLAALARDIGQQAGSLNADVLHLVGRISIAVDRQQPDEFDRAWSELVDRHAYMLGQVEATAGWEAYLATRIGRVDAARAALARAGHRPLDHIPDDQEWLAAVTQFVGAGIVVGDADLVRDSYRQLLPHARLGVFDGAGATDHGVVDRYLACAAAFLGDRDAARRHVDDALRGNAAAGRLVLAHTKLDGARALLDGAPADRDQAVRLATEAARLLEALGLSELAAQARALTGSTPARRPGPGDAAPPELVREGDTWAFTYGDRTVRLNHAKGIADLAVLLGNPGQEIHVRTLAGVDHLQGPSTKQPTLDDTAVASYRDRLAQLEQELQEADDHHDLARATQLGVERDALVDELTRAFGIAGRARPVGSDPDERLRKAVSARVKASVSKITDLHPELGRHLRNAVRTGYWCCYEPERPTRWKVSADRPS